MAKKDTSLSFRASERFAEHFGKRVVDLDKSSSKVIRACICLALPQLEANPILFRILDDDDLCGQSD